MMRMIRYSVIRFQSSLPRGSDGITTCLVSSIPQFQSSLPRGSDKLDSSYLPLALDFNPRSLAGATQSVHFIVTYLHISILAPSRERLLLAM